MNIFLWPYNHRSFIATFRFMQVLQQGKLQFIGFLLPARIAQSRAAWWLLRRAMFPNLAHGLGSRRLVFVNPSCCANSNVSLAFRTQIGRIPAPFDRKSLGPSERQHARLRPPRSSWSNVVPCRVSCDIKKNAHSALEVRASSMMNSMHPGVLCKS